MRNLIPFDFAQLGVVEFLWFTVAFGGLSLIASGRRRLPAALWIGAILATFGLVRWLRLEAGGSAWLRWLGPMLVLPLWGAGLVLLGLWRPRLSRRHLGAWVVLLLGLPASAAPFGLPRNPLSPEWLFLLSILFGLAALVQGEGGARALLALRVIGKLRGRSLAALLFLLLCLVGQPFGIQWVGGLAILLVAWLIHSVLAQGAEMRRYVARRLAGAPIVLLLLLTVSFFLIRSAPGGPFDKDKRLEPAIKKVVEAKYRMNEPLLVQFRYYMVELIWDGDLGPSFKHKDHSVNEIIGTHAPQSARLGLAAACLAVILGVTAGLVSGIRQNSIFDYASMTVAMLGLALPTFIVGPMLVLAFSMKLDWFSVTGWEVFPRDLILPAVTLALPFMARIARLTRAGMLEIVHQDYIRTARAKGLSEPAIVIRHTLKGTLLPVVSFLGPGVAQLLTGSLVVERIFGVPGMGNEFVESALNRDYGVAMGLVLVFGTLLVLFNLVVDIFYAFLDPRIRHG